MIRLASLALLTTMLSVPGAIAQHDAAHVHRVYTHLLEPREHPDYDRRHVQPPSWDTFDNQTQFVTLRGFGEENGKLVGYKETLDQYTVTHRLGRVVWPSYNIVFAENLRDLAEEIKARDLFLFDIWGYVPGSGPGGYWQQFQVPDGVFDMLEATLGDHWLGMDIGEQDGRYIGGYAGQMLPVSNDRFVQYLNFQRHFEKMGDELGNRLSTLVSLNFGHYFLKEGTYATIGAETAQALPNSQVYYAFIRGAGKQYGVPWFGNASVWNRWGWKNYGSEGDTYGPTQGTSLNLLKRLLYSHIFYNSVFVGFENGWFEGGDTLSPIGRIQQAAQEWVREQGEPGVMVTPVAFMADFFSGWSFPRHLYTGNVYRVWGNIPYDEGDYLTDALLDLFYPGYQDASYYHDERGFQTPTPYGDSVDCLLSDAPGWLLARYPVVVLADDIAASVELHDILTAYVEQGGCLVVTAGNLAKYPDGLAGVAIHDGALRGPDHARVLDGTPEHPEALEAAFGQGRVIAFASPFGLRPNPATVDTIENKVDAPLYKPMLLEGNVRAVLDTLFRDAMLFDAGPGLSAVTCRKAAGEYTLCVANNGLSEQPLAITSHCGPLASITEHTLDLSEQDAAGYLPDGFAEASIGTSTDEVIAGGDVRIFTVRVHEDNVEEIPHVVPPARPAGRILPLRGMEPVKEQILARPTFFAHYDGAVVDWRYLHARDIDALAAESGWLRRQGVRLWVDFTSGINLYPDLRLVENDEAPYGESMSVFEDVFAKMSAWGAADAILSLHRVPENNISADDTRQSFEKTLRALAETAAGHGITLYVRTSTKDGLNVQQTRELLEKTGAANLQLAVDTAIVLDKGWTTEKLERATGGNVALWLASAPAYDVAGALWSTNAPVADSGHEEALRALLRETEVPVLIDAVYDDQDAEYRDAQMIERLIAP